MDVRDAVRASRAGQGLPASVCDPAALAEVAALIIAQRATAPKPRRTRVVRRRNPAVRR